MKIGVLGTGRIVWSVFPPLKEIDEIECYAIASRTIEKAEEAAKEIGFQKAYGSYEELVCDPEVELVYIATPHSRHYEDMKLCITHKKPVLCEKAFTMNAKEAASIKELAAKEGVFVAEAIWTRYMPSRAIIQKVVDSGIIGNISMLTANLSYAISNKERIVSPMLAGGALLDVGVYGLNFAMMHFGTDIEKLESSVSFTETGVDGMESITMHFKDGRMAVLSHGIYGRSDRQGIFYGDKGYIVVENINNPHSVSVYDMEDRLIERYEVPPQANGYEYEFLECIRLIREGKLESTSMTLDESICVMDTMDEIRRSWGLIYPKEKEQIRLTF